MNKLIAHIEATRSEILNRARRVSAYFSSGGGTKASAGEERELAWTSEEQIKRAKEFRELAAKLAKEENRAA